MLISGQRRRPDHARESLLAAGAVGAGCSHVLLQQAELLLERERLAAVAQFGRAQGGGMQLVERAQPGAGADPRPQRVLVAVAVGDRLLAVLADQEREQLLRGRLVVSST